MKPQTSKRLSKSLVKKGFLIICHQSIVPIPLSFGDSGVEVEVGLEIRRIMITHISASCELYRRISKVSTSIRKPKATRSKHLVLFAIARNIKSTSRFWETIVLLFLNTDNIKQNMSINTRIENAFNSS